MTENEKDILMGACYHEAGHAVIAEIVSPGSVNHIVISADLSFVSCAKSQNPLDDALIFAAGAYAQTRFVNEGKVQRWKDHIAGRRQSPYFAGRGYYHGVKGDDALYLDRALREGGYQHFNLEDGRRDIYLTAHRHVSEFWPEIEAVAKVLIQQGLGRMERETFLQALDGQLLGRA